VIACDEFPNALSDERFDVVIDPVGGDLRTASLDVMAPLGRLLTLGNASGDWQHTVETNQLWLSNLAILGFNVGFYLPTHLQFARPAAEGALKAAREGLIDLHTDTLPLENASEAHRQIEAGHVNGRILLVIGTRRTPGSELHRRCGSVIDPPAPEALRQPASWATVLLPRTSGSLAACLSSGGDT
jgi:NADPH2:quinone reductase